jgi:plastocyanin
MPDLSVRGRRLRPPLVAAPLALAVAAVALEPAWAALSRTPRIVPQKGRRYAPTDLFLRRGDTITLRDADASLSHHGFVEADRFTFEAGDQEPGPGIRLTLAEPGDFAIRCGLHPTMTLTLCVQSRGPSRRRQGRGISRPGRSPARG